MADGDDEKLRKAVRSAATDAGGALGDAAARVKAARLTFNRGVGAASWNSVGRQAARNGDLKAKHGAAMAAIARAESAVAAAKTACAALAGAAGR